MRGLRKWLSGALLAVGLASLSAGAWAEGALPLAKAPVDNTNMPSLQRGAKIFANYCLSCHSAALVRYTRLQDLGLTEEEITKNLIFTTQKFGETMRVAMDTEQGKKWFGTAPPDLSVMARALAGNGGSGADYIYTLFRSFYRDPGTATGWNNLLFPRIAMPHPLWELQGEREPVFKQESVNGRATEVFTGEWKQVTPGTLSPVEYDRTVGDLANYMAWMSDPSQHQRHQIGIWVLLFIAVLTFFAWRLNAAYWKDVK